MTVSASLGWDTVLGLLNYDNLVASTDADLACHHGGNEGTSAVASLPAGSKITFQWAYVSGFPRDRILNQQLRVSALQKVAWRYAWLLVFRLGFPKNY